MEATNQDFINLDIAEEEKNNISTKEVISKWRKRARVVHPDKVSEEEKQEANTRMIELNKSLENVLKYVQERDNNRKKNEENEECSEETEEEQSDEQVFTKEYFKKFNFPQENTNSFTIHISNVDAEPWRNAFYNSYGEPTLTTHKVSNKVMDRWWKFDYEGITITLHLYINEGTANKILVQGGNKFVLINYVFSQLPKMYTDVKSNMSLKSNDSSVFFSPKTRRQKSMLQSSSKRLVQCEYCHIRKSRDEIKMHIKTNHNAPTTMKPRSIPYRERRKAVLLRNQAIMNERKQKKKEHLEVENGDMKSKTYPTESVASDEMDTTDNAQENVDNEDNKNTKDKSKLIFEDYKKFKCQQCSNEYRTELELTLHLMEHSPKVIFNCDTCDKYFFSDANLKLHKTSIHSNRENNKEDTGQISENREDLKPGSPTSIHPKEQRDNSEHSNVEKRVERMEDKEMKRNSEAEKVDEQIVQQSSIETQTDKIPARCEECPKLKTRQAELIGENVKEKTSRLKAESNFDIKKKRYDNAMKDIANLKKELKTLSESKQKLIVTLNKKLNKEKETEDVIKKLTNKNTDLLNENKTYKKLYEEEIKKQEESHETPETEFKDYDNILYEDEDSEVEEVPTENENTDRSKRIQCDQCSFTTTSTTTLRNHKSSCQKCFKCNKCDFSSQHESMLQQHKKEAHQKETHKKCNECNYVSTSEQSMREHKMNVHKKSTKYASKKQDQLQCDFCDFKSMHAFEINLHEHKAHKQSKIKCNLCDFTAKNEDILRKHHEVAMGHKKSIVCKFYLNGVCKYGKFCRFTHKTSNNPSNKYDKTNKFEKSHQNNNRRNKQCKFFDNCQLFPNCGYEHYEVCKYQENCASGERCKYVHLNFLGRSLVQKRGW